MWYTLEDFRLYLLNKTSITSIDSYLSGVRRVYESLFNVNPKLDEELKKLTRDNDKIIHYLKIKPNKNNCSYLNKFLQMEDEGFKIDGFEPQFDYSTKPSVFSKENILRFKLGIINAINDYHGYNMDLSLKLFLDEDIQNGYVVYLNEKKSYYRIMRDDRVHSLSSEQLNFILESFVNNIFKYRSDVYLRKISNPIFDTNNFDIWLKNMKCLRKIFYSPNVIEPYFKPIEYKKIKNYREEVYCKTFNSLNEQSVYVPIIKEKVIADPSIYSDVEYFVLGKMNLLGYAAQDNYQTGCNTIFMCEDYIKKNSFFLNETNLEKIELDHGVILDRSKMKMELYLQVFAHELAHCFCNHIKDERMPKEEINYCHEQTAQSLSSIFLLDKMFSACIRAFSYRQPIEYQNMRLYELNDF